MKSFIVSVCALATVTSLVFLNSFFTAKCIDEVMEKIDETGDDASPEEFYELSDFYMTRQTYLSLTVCHDDLTNIEDIIAELIGAAEAGDSDGIKIAKSRLSSALSHVRRLSGINFDSIL